MNNLLYLFIAYAFIWTGLFVYLLTIAIKISKARKELELVREKSK